MAVLGNPGKNGRATLSYQERIFIELGMRQAMRHMQMSGLSSNLSMVSLNFMNWKQ